MKRRVYEVSELRANSRVQTCMHCDLFVEQKTCPGQLLNISLSGALVSSACNPAIGSPATMTLELVEPGRKISLAGYVVRVKQASSTHDQLYQIGIRFNAITPDGMILLKAALENKNTVLPRLEIEY